MKADGLYDAKCVERKSRQINAGKIHCRAKMLLHNWDNLINFVAVPRSCRNFQGKGG